MENLVIGLIVLNVVLTITVISVIIADNQNQTTKIIEEVKKLIKGE
jgi:hypothetical protein